MFKLNIRVKLHQVTFCIVKRDSKVTFIVKKIVKIPGRVSAMGDPGGRLRNIRKYAILLTTNPMMITGSLPFFAVIPPIKPNMIPPTNTK